MTINGTYGSSKRKCDVFVYENRNGRYYCVEGYKNVNYTYDEILDGVDVEELNDVGTFTWSSPVESYAELVEAVDN